MPNPSASSPPHRSRHGIANTSAHAYSGGKVVVGHAAEEPHPVADAASPRAALEAARGRARRPRSRAARRADPRPRR